MEIKMRWVEKLYFHALCSLTNFRVPQEASRLLIKTFAKKCLSGNAKKLPMNAKFLRGVRKCVWRFRGSVQD